MRPNLFMVNYQEENKLTGTDIEDYEKGVLYANMTTPNDNFISKKGTLKEQDRNRLRTRYTLISPLSLTKS